MKTNRHSTLLKKAVHLITYNSSHKLICLLGFLLLCSMNTYAQNYVSGTVKDNNGEPLLGVSIKVKDGNIVSGTVTDFNGHYQVKADPSSTIEFSYIGFKTVQFTVGDRKMINVTLEVDDNLLDEVVVVGYGTQKKINLTGSVGVIDSKAFEAIPVSNAVQALQGQVPGLNIYSNQGGGLNQKQSINVRGVGTIGEGSTGSALVLIDGMEGDIYSINPQDIESISVLKDAAASSIYGSRAPFGVILVTTKKGKAGKAQVNYNNSFRVSSPINMPSSLDSYTFSLYYNDAAANSGWGPYNWVSEERINRIKDYMAGKITDSTIPVPNNPSLWADGYSQGNDNIDYYDYFFKDNVFAHEHNISVTGGTDKIQYYLSANYLGQDGELRIGDEYSNRYTASAKINAQLSKIVSVGFNTRFIRSDYVQPTHLNESFFAEIGRQCWPTKPLYDPNGILYDDHVLQMQNGGEKQERNTWLYQQLNITVEPIKGWRLIGDLSYRYNTQYSHWDYLTVHQTGVDGKTKGNTWNNDSQVHEGTYASDYFNVNLYTDYAKTFAKSHNMKVLFGFQAEQNNYKDIAAEKLGVIYPGKPTINTSTGMDSNNQKVAPNVAGGHNRWATAGFFGRLNYDYLEKYLLEVNLRYDGSSRFRSDSRWGFFPSASVGWNIAREKFFLPVSKVVNTFKVRASYGSLGNQDLKENYYAYLATMGSGKISQILDGKQPVYVDVPGLVSGALTWEKVSTSNIAVDMNFLNNRLTFSGDYYVRRTTDMLTSGEPLPNVLGTSVPKENTADLKTEGWEITLGWKDQFKLAGKPFDYQLGFNLADSRAYITKFQNTTGTLSSKYEGMEIGEIWGYTTLGFFTSQEDIDNHADQSKLASYPSSRPIAPGDLKFADLDGDGEVYRGANTLDDHGDLRIIGNSRARYTYGFTASGSWNGFDFSLFLQGVGKKDYNPSGDLYFWGIYAQPWTNITVGNYYDRWTEENPDGYFPRLKGYVAESSSKEAGLPQTRYLQDASYMRLKNVTLGYTLPEQWMNKIGINRVRIYLSGDNLFTISGLYKHYKVDPEGLGGQKYPLQRSYSFGLNVTF